MKERILFAAAQEMNERGVKFTIDAVAVRLGISKKTIYQYYPSKDMLITSIVDAALDDIIAQRTKIIASDADFVSKLTDIVTLEPKLFGKINDWVYDDIRRFRPCDWDRVTRFRRERIKVIAGVLEQGIESGHVRQINPVVAAQILLSTVGGFLEYKFLNENNLTFTSALQALNDIFLFGVLAPPAVCRDRSKTSSGCF